MSVRREADVVYLEAQCRVEDAELLSLHLQSGATRVDASGCELMHAAVFQALIAFAARVEGAPGEPALSAWLALLAPAEK